MVRKAVLAGSLFIVGTMLAATGAQALPYGYYESPWYQRQLYLKERQRAEAQYYKDRAYAQAWRYKYGGYGQRPYYGY